MKYKELIESLTKNAVVYVHTGTRDRLAAYLQAHGACVVPDVPVVTVYDKTNNTVDVYRGAVKEHHSVDDEVDEDVVKRLVGAAVVAYDDIGFTIFVPCEKFRS
jgi:hypothetical protein